MEIMQMGEFLGRGCGVFGFRFVMAIFKRILRSICCVTFRMGSIKTWEIWEFVRVYGSNALKVLDIIVLVENLRNCVIIIIQRVCNVVNDNR